MKAASPLKNSCVLLLHGDLSFKHTLFLISHITAEFSFKIAGEEVSMPKTFKKATLVFNNAVGFPRQDERRSILAGTQTSSTNCSYA